MSRGRYVNRNPVLKSRTPAYLLLLLLLLSLLPAPAVKAQIPDHPAAHRMSGRRDSTVTALTDTLAWQRPFGIVTIDSFEMAHLPALTLEEIVALQAGYTEQWDERNRRPRYRDRGITEFHLFGARAGQTAFILDGLRLCELSYSGIPEEIPRAGLGGLIIQSGGIGAGTPNALGGVVSLVTRRGGSSWRAEVEVGSSEVSGRAADDVRDLTVVDGYLGGPLPSAGLTLMLSGSARTGRDMAVHKDGLTFDRSVDPADPASFRPPITYEESSVYSQWGPDGRAIEPLDIYSGWLGYGQRTGWDVLASLSWRQEELGTVHLSALRAHSERMPYTHPWRYTMFAGLPSEIEQNAVLGSPRYDAADPSEIIPGTGVIDWPNERNRRRLDSDRLTLRWSFLSRPDLRGTLRAEYASRETTMRVERWVNAAGWSPSYDNCYTLTDSLGHPLWTPDDPMTLVTLEPLPFDPDDEYRRRHGYARLETGSSFNDGSDRWYGDEAQIRRTLRIDLSTEPGPGLRFTAGGEGRWLTFKEHEIDNPALTPPGIIEYRFNPWEAAGWITVHVTGDDLILEAGLRCDAYRGRDMPHWLSPRDPMDEEGNLVIDPFDPETAPEKQAATQRRISPHLGLAHPLSERTAVYADYGHYVSPPPWQMLFIQGKLADSSPLIGNPALTPETSAVFTFGLRHQLTPDLGLEAAFRARDVNALASAELVPAFFGGVSNPYSYTIFLNVDTARIREFSLRLQRRWRGAWSGRLEYTALESAYNRADPWTGFNDKQNLQTMPKRLSPAPWDRTHTVTGLLNLRFEKGRGPRLAGLRPLERTSAGVVLRAASGRPYTPVTSEGEEDGYLSARMPWSVRMDLRLDREITLFGLDLDLFADVRNLFDRRNALLVYTRTGRADDPGPEAGGTSDDWDRSHYLDVPLLINAGIRIRF